MEMTKIGQTNRLPYLAAGCISILFLGVIYAWTIFSNAFAATAYGWSAAQRSFNFTLNNIFSSSMAFVGGKLMQKVKSRVLAIAAAILILIGFNGASLLQFGGGLWTLYLFYGVIAGMGQGLAYIIALTFPAKWYPDKPGLVSGLLLMFIGFGTLVISGAVEKIVEAYGLYVSLRITGIAVAAVVGISGIWMVAPGKDVILPPAAKKVDAEADEDINTNTMVKRGAFWLYFFWNICIASAGLTILNSVADIAEAFGVITIAAMIVSLFNSGGRLLFGALIDRIGRKRSIILNNSILAAAGVLLLAGALSVNKILVFIGIMLTGVAFGANLTLRLAGIKELFGSTYSAENFGLCNLCVIPASIIGPFISGLLQDAENGGYKGTFVMVIIFAVCAFILNFALNKISAKRNAK